MKKATIIITAFVLCAFIVCLCACSSSGANGTQGDSGKLLTEAAAGSLRAIHNDEQWAPIEKDSSKKTCLGCHSRDSIVAATANYKGIEGLNPHASHTESYDCTKCHSLTGTNVLVCNTACHGGYHGDGEGWPLPNENWADPTEELPAADGEAIPHNA